MDIFNIIRWCHIVSFSHLPDYVYLLFLSPMFNSYQYFDITSFNFSWSCVCKNSVSFWFEFHLLLLRLRMYSYICWVLGPVEFLFFSFIVFILVVFLESPLNFLKHTYNWLWSFCSHCYSVCISFLSLPLSLFCFYLLERQNKRERQTLWHRVPICWFTC